MILPLGAWVASDSSRRLSVLVQRTFQRMDLSRKELEEHCGLSEKQLSDQLTLKHPLNLWRLADIPGFLRAFMLVLAEEEEHVAYPSERVRLIVQVVESPRPMLKASLPCAKKSEEVA